MIVSTGMTTAAEVDDAVRAARGAGCREFVPLKCTSTYPASPVNTNLRTLPALREIFGCPVGLSDRTMGVGVAVAAVALGAVVVEKHFTLRRADGSPGCERVRLPSAASADHRLRRLEHVGPAEGGHPGEQDQLAVSSDRP